MKSFVYNTYFRKRGRNKHVSATKPLSFFSLMLLLFPQTQLNQLHLSGNALEVKKKKKKKIDYRGPELHFKSTEEILFPTHSHFISYLQFRVEYSPNRKRWGGGHGIDSDSRDIWYSPFILKNSPRCPSVNRIIAPPTTSPDAKAPGWTKPKRLWKMGLRPPASICSGILCFSHLSLFLFRAMQDAAFHSRHVPLQLRVCVSCPCQPWSYMGEEITYWFSFL